MDHVVVSAASALPHRLRRVVGAPEHVARITVRLRPSDSDRGLLLAAIRDALGDAGYDLHVLHGSALVRSAEGATAEQLVADDEARAERSESWWRHDLVWRHATDPTTVVAPLTVDPWALTFCGWGPSADDMLAVVAAATAREA